jgi:hypothetical protein
MCDVRLLALILCISGLLFAANEVEGNFTIRFEPTAKLQTGVEVPFTVHVTDDRKRPLEQNAHVEMAIAPENREPIKTIRAWYVGPGEFIAKPVFPSEGQWTLTVTARRANQVTTRAITFSVAP